MNTSIEADDDRYLAFLNDHVALLIEQSAFVKEQGTFVKEQLSRMHEQNSMFVEVIEHARQLQLHLDHQKKVTDLVYETLKSVCGKDVETQLEIVAGMNKEMRALVEGLEAQVRFGNDNSFCKPTPASD